jgi:hypothetical protein
MEQEVQGTSSAEKLVEVYLKIRDASENNYRSYMAKKADLEEQMDVVQTELLDILKNIDATSLRTSHGLARRSVKQRYTTNDWSASISLFWNTMPLSYWKEEFNKPI